MVVYSYKLLTTVSLADFVLQLFTCWLIFMKPALKHPVSTVHPRYTRGCCCLLTLHSPSWHFPPRHWRCDIVLCKAVFLWEHWLNGSVSVHPSMPVYGSQMQPRCGSQRCLSETTLLETCPCPCSWRMARWAHARTHTHTHINKHTNALTHTHTILTYIILPLKHAFTLNLIVIYIMGTFFSSEDLNVHTPVDAPIHLFTVPPR